jgi:hypothetical protein
MGCTSSSAGSNVVENPHKPEHFPHKVINKNIEQLQSHTFDENYASASHICDFLAVSDLPRNPYRRVDAKPLFVVKSKCLNSQADTELDEEQKQVEKPSKKAFINIFRSSEMTVSVIEILKYIWQKNGEDCDVYNVIIRNHAKYFRDEEARDEVTSYVFTLADCLFL